MLKLELISGPQKGRMVRVSDDAPVPIGRNFGRLRLHDSRVSKHHAQIIYAGGGSWVLRDLGSSNGSYVNQERLTSIAELEKGDTIQFGRIVIRVREADDKGVQSVVPEPTVDEPASPLAGLSVGSIFDEEPATPEAKADARPASADAGLNLGEPDADNELDLDALFEEADRDDGLAQEDEDAGAVGAAKADKDEADTEDDRPLGEPVVFGEADEPADDTPPQVKSLELQTPGDDADDDEADAQAQADDGEDASAQGTDDQVQIDDDRPDAGKMPGTTMVLASDTLAAAAGSDRSSIPPAQDDPAEQDAQDTPDTDDNADDAIGLAQEPARASVFDQATEDDAASDDAAAQEKLAHDQDLIRIDDDAPIAPPTEPGEAEDASAQAEAGPEIEAEDEVEVEAEVEAQAEAEIEAEPQDIAQPEQATAETDTVAAAADEDADQDPAAADAFDVADDEDFGQASVFEDDLGHSSGSWLIAGDNDTSDPDLLYPGDATEPQAPAQPPAEAATGGQLVWEAADDSGENNDDDHTDALAQADAPEAAPDAAQGVEPEPTTDVTEEVAPDEAEVDGRIEDTVVDEAEAEVAAEAEVEPEAEVQTQPEAEVEPEREDAVNAEVEDEAEDAVNDEVEDEAEDAVNDEVDAEMEAEPATESDTAIITAATQADDPADDAPVAAHADTSANDAEPGPQDEAATPTATAPAASDTPDPPPDTPAEPDLPPAPTNVGYLRAALAHLVDTEPDPAPSPAAPPAATASTPEALRAALAKEPDTPAQPDADLASLDDAAPAADTDEAAGKDPAATDFDAPPPADLDASLGSADAIADELDRDQRSDHDALLAADSPFPGQSSADADLAPDDAFGSHLGTPAVNPTTTLPPSEPRTSRRSVPDWNHRAAKRRTAAIVGGLLLLLAGAGLYVGVFNPSIIAGRGDDNTQPDTDTTPTGPGDFIPGGDPQDSRIPNNPGPLNPGSNPGSNNPGPGNTTPPPNTNPYLGQAPPFNPDNGNTPGGSQAPTPFATLARVIGADALAGRTTDDPSVPRPNTPTPDPGDNTPTPGQTGDNGNMLPPINLPEGGGSTTPGAEPVPVVDPLPPDPGPPVPPTDPNAPTDGERLVFLVDCSGSMVDSLPQMLVWLGQAIDTLEPEQRFTIIFFKKDRAIEPEPAGLRPFTRATQRALENDWLDPDAAPVLPSGRSDPDRALKLALTYDPTDIYILSDESFGLSAGDTTPEEARAAFTQSLGDAQPRVHGVQFFYNDSDGTLESLAEIYGGTYEFVAEARHPDRDPIDLLEELENRNP